MTARSRGPRKRQHRGLGLGAWPPPWWGTAAKVGAALAGVIGLLASLTGVVDWVREQIDPKVPTLSAHIDGVRLRESSQPLGDYVREVGAYDRTYSPEELARPGYSLLLMLSARGKEGTTYRLRWELHDVASGRVRGPDFNQPVASFKTAAADQRRAWPVWVPWPTRSGRYFVRFTLEDANHRPIDEQDSSTFRHTSRASASP